MGTDLQNVFDSFFIKIPNVDFTSKEDQVYQFFKTANAKCNRKTYDNLDHTYNGDLKEGNYVHVISQQSIELVAMYMVREYYYQLFSILLSRKTYLGTQAFNKIPSNKEQFELIKYQMDKWENDIKEFESDFPDYSDER